MIARDKECRHQRINSNGCGDFRVLKKLLVIRLVIVKETK